ncbi:MAG TPA: hypothetical protein VN669_07490 [Candidatus Acidoferrales bacterium]|jgi:hypothetical protein|nr:hypothetical protein [Candidatus Acidoferrales bacterium]
MMFVSLTAGVGEGVGVLLGVGLGLGLGVGLALGVGDGLGSPPDEDALSAPEPPHPATTAKMSTSARMQYEEN